MEAHHRAWHSEDASKRRKTEELRIIRLLTDAGIPFEYNVYTCCRALGGTFRFVDFKILINGGVIYLEIGEHMLLASTSVQTHSAGYHSSCQCR